MAGHHQPPARTLRAQGDVALVALETTVTAGLEGFQNKKSVYSCENQDPVFTFLFCVQAFPGKGRVDS
jgi:hypothetical protein